MTARLPTAVTFLCHDLGRDPTSLLALELARWLAQESTAVEVAALWDGPRHDAFARLGPVHVVNPSDPDPLPAGRDGLDIRPTDPPGPRSIDPAVAIARGARAAGAALRAVRRPAAADRLQALGLRALLHRRDRPVWVAGPAAARLLHYVPADRPVVVHLPEGAQAPADPDDRAVLDERADHRVVGAPDQVTGGGRCPTTVLPDRGLLPDAPVHRDRTRQLLLDRLGLDATSRLVGSAGQVDWWEVPDAFVQIAWEVARRPGGDDVRFLWVAGHSTERELWPLHHDLRHAGLDERVRVVRAVDHPDLDPLTALAALDVVLLSRRGVVSWPQLPLIEGVGVPIVRWARTDARPPERPGEVVGHTRLVTQADDRGAAGAILDLLDDQVVGVRARAAAAEIRLRSGVSHGGPIAAGAIDAALSARARGTRPRSSA